MSDRRQQCAHGPVSVNSVDDLEAISKLLLLSKATGGDKTATSNEIFQVYRQVTKSVVELIRLAETGDKSPVYLLFMLTMRMVEALESVVKRRPKLGRSIARNTFAWPAMISRNRALIKENEKLIQTLELGKNGVFSAGGRQLSARSTLAALKLFTIGQWRVADGLCSTLTKKNKKRWFDENWKWLVSEVCQPEDTKFFRPLGESKAKRKPKYCKQLHPATQRANIRSEIKTKVWRAFDEIITPTK